MMHRSAERLGLPGGSAARTLRRGNVYDAGMTVEGPWQRYYRDQLPKGWAYPLGRDEVTAHLAETGVSLGSLSFSRTDPNQSANLYVLGIY